MTRIRLNTKSVDEAVNVNPMTALLPHNVDVVNTEDLTRWAIYFNCVKVVEAERSHPGDQSLSHHTNMLNVLGLPDYDVHVVANTDKPLAEQFSDLDILGPEMTEEDYDRLFGPLDPSVKYDHPDPVVYY